MLRILVTSHRTVFIYPTKPITRQRFPRGFSFHPIKPNDSVNENKIVFQDLPTGQFTKTLNLPKTDFPMRFNALEREPKLIKNVYEWQMTHNPGDLFVTHDGPPFANGKPHLGHVLNKVLKDIVNRYKVLRGYKVSYVPGWDCHGLPIELKAMEGYKDSALFSLTPLEIRQRAYHYAIQQIELQKKEFIRWGIMGDWDHPYRTLDTKYEAKQIAIFGLMVKKGLIYRGLKPVYWSPSSRTALADAELEYVEDHVSPSVFVTFPVTQLPSQLNRLNQLSERLSVVIWTTTPWTLPANLAVSVHPKMQYCVVKYKDNNFLLVAQSRREFLEKSLQTSLPVLDVFLGSDLVGMKCQHPFLDDRESPVIFGDHVTPDTGTGLVHTAPGHGFDDFAVCKPYNFKVLSPVDDEGRFTAEAGPLFVGKFVLTEGNDAVLRELQRRGRLLKHENYVHKYPYDWRTKKPVIIRMTKQWFADLSTIKETALKAIEHVKIIPESGRARLQAFVRSRDEWCISRQRHWGVPIPVFYDIETDCELLNEETIKYVQNLFQKYGANCWWELSTEELLHPAYRNNGRKYRRGTDTMDVWFDSGVSWAAVVEEIFMNYEQQQQQQQQQQQKATQSLAIEKRDSSSPWKFCGFVFRSSRNENKVADLYIEGSDQHRGWFNSSLLTSVAVTGKAPYKALLTHGFVLDAQQRKMSKSLGNVIEPSLIIEGGPDKKRNPAYGVDVMRLWVASSDYTDDISVSESLLEVTAQNLRKLRNTARYMLGNLYDFSLQNGVPYDSLTELDKYMLHQLYQFQNEITEAYEELNFTRVCRVLIAFANADLSAFYFDILKDRLYTSNPNSQRRRAAQTVMFKILEIFTKSLAPILPHTAEDIYEHAKSIWKTSDRVVEDNESIFQQGWMNVREEWRNDELNNRWKHVRELKSRFNKLFETIKTTQKLSVTIGLEVEVDLYVAKEGPFARTVLRYLTVEDLTELLIVSKVNVIEVDKISLELVPIEHRANALSESEDPSYIVVLRKSPFHKCPRCWKRISVQPDQLCSLCSSVIQALS